MQGVLQQLNKHLHKQAGLSNPVLHPKHNPTNSKIVTIRKIPNFFNLSLHLNKTKHGKLKNETHYVSHI